MDFVYVDIEVIIETIFLEWMVKVYGFTFPEIIDDESCRCWESRYAIQVLKIKYNLVKIFMT